MAERAPQAQFVGLDPSSSHLCVRLYTCVHPDYSKSGYNKHGFSRQYVSPSGPSDLRPRFSGSCSLVFAKLETLRFSCLHALVCSSIQLLLSCTSHLCLLPCV